MKDWTLSDTVITAAITTVGGIVVAWIKNRKPKVPETARPASAPSQEPALPPVVELSPAPIYPPATKPTRPPVSQLSIEEIVSVLKSVPPFHHDQIKGNYLGLRVRWEALLTDVSARSGGIVNVAADTADYHYLSCEAQRDDVLSLINAPAKTPIIIDGTLTGVGVGHCNLTDCVIRAKAAVN